MSLGIKTFDNKSHSGDPLFKALGHPAVCSRVGEWIANTGRYGRLAVFDPWGQFSSLSALYEISTLDITGHYVQRIEDLTQECRLITSFDPATADAVVLAAFDDDHARRALSPLLPEGMPVIGFDDLRLPPELLTNKRRYLDPINFATNFALFRAGKGRHSIVRSAEYWTAYGATAPRLSMILFDGDGARLAEWNETLAPKQSIVLDAAEIRDRFGLPVFEGMLFIHASGIAGHDILKYVLDDVDDALRDPAVTHDSNSWPAEYYSGLPAPAAGETVNLWLQNSHPSAIAPCSLLVSPMGLDQWVPVPHRIPGFGTISINIATLLPGVAWPAQIEIATGNHVVRPRYEVTNGRDVTFAHMNVERVDLKPDPAIAAAAEYLGKGYLLPAPIFPIGQWHNLALPTPAARGQNRLSLTIIAYDAEGREVLRHDPGLCERAAMPEIDVNALLAEQGITDPGFEGHFELLYDFAKGVDVDGWLHALFRYHDRLGGQTGDTSFGAHVFNLPVTFKDQPQSYAGRPPGLSTRLFARLMPAPLDAFVHLTYPCSGTWRPHSDTKITLHDRSGASLAEIRIDIPLNGSRVLHASRVFEAGILAEAGHRGYMIIEDRTCRLFGYHGVTGPDGQFALDHMFGF